MFSLGKCNVLGVLIGAVDHEGTIAVILRAIEERKTAFV